MSTPTGTIASRLARSDRGFDDRQGDFDILNAALRATGLDAALADPAASLTLLAPTDAAFLSLARSLGFEGQDEAGAFDAIVAALTSLAPDGNPIPLLTDVLRYHVVPEPLTTAGIARTPELPTLLDGATVRPFAGALQDGDPDAADARLQPLFLETGNGNIQAINEVLLPINLPGNSDGLPTPPSIAGIVAASGNGFDTNAADFDILLRAASDAGLVSALADPAADLTVFAPTDAAFVQLARTFGFTGTDEAGAYDAIVATLTGLAPDGNPIPLLTDVLTYHVVPERLDVRQLNAEDTITTLNGATLDVRGTTVVDAEPELRDARLVPGQTDVAASNGAVQAIDRVLLPFDLDLSGPGLGSSIADQLAASGSGFDTNRQDFDILNAALDAAGLTATLDNLSLDLTLFAPTDAAFLRLARDLGFRGRDEAGAFDAIVDGLTALSPDGNPVPLLTDILTYHVSGQSLTAAEIVAAPSVTTLSGEAITPFGRQLIDLDPTLPDARVIVGRADLQATNGVVQAIDRVLLPLDVPQAGPGTAPLPTLAGLLDASGDGFDRNGHDFDILNAALEAVGLDGALGDAAASLTLLAPTDAGFVRLAQRFGFGGEDEAGAFGAIVQALTSLGGGDPNPVLTDILSYHVLDGTFSKQQLRAEGSVETLLGPDLVFRGNGIRDAEPGYAVRFDEGGDVLAANGALQAIDNVLLPVNLDLI
ncbi:fasciclin domain-containing protein [Roseomonas sp. CCTCC AB2023176]|uniref:fasciclin domain-containing protein n=1 Tax=Roseomonas sp. CCTCC AB2023176 TaxID=3342640 RepID=UPI0035DB76EB